MKNLKLYLPLERLQELEVMLSPGDRIVDGILCAKGVTNILLYLDPRFHSVTKTVTFLC